jgi:choline dehydrogenase-like flavoprotein
MRYDVVIIGAGSAGNVLATRLSEGQERAVLLLEAGPDYPDFDRLPDDLRLGNNTSAAIAGPHSWGFSGTANTHQNEPMLVLRGKITGGAFVKRRISVADHQSRSLSCRLGTEQERLGASMDGRRRVWLGRGQSHGAWQRFPGDHRQCLHPDASGR